MEEQNNLQESIVDKNKTTNTQPDRKRKREQAEIEPNSKKRRMQPIEQTPTTIFSLLMTQGTGCAPKFTDLNKLHTSIQSFARLDEELSELLPPDEKIERIINTCDNDAVKALASTCSSIKFIQKQVESRLTTLKEIKETSAVIRHIQLKAKYHETLRNLTDLQEKCVSKIDIFENRIPCTINFKGLLQQANKKYNLINQMLLENNQGYTQEDYIRISQVPDDLEYDELAEERGNLDIEKDNFSDAEKSLEKTLSSLNTFLQKNTTQTTTQLTNAINNFSSKVELKIKQFQMMQEAYHIAIRNIKNRLSHGYLNYTGDVQRWLLDNINNSDGNTYIKTAYIWAEEQIMSNKDLQEVLKSLSESASSDSSKEEKKVSEDPHESKYSESSREEMTCQDLNHALEKILLKDWQAHIGELSRGLIIR